MNTIPQLNVVASLPVAELNESLRLFLEPVTSLWPDAQLKAVAELLVQGVVSSQSPLVTQMARGVSHPEETIWPTCQRVYRFLGNERFNHWTLQKGLYRVGQVTVAEQRPEYLVIAVDPVNFEKPYTAKLEGVSTVIKSRPPSFTGEKRKTRGYPAITATVVNLKQPAVSYAQCGNASGGCPGGFVIRAVVGRQYYRPYGGPRGAAVALPTDRAFTGQYRDATGLDFYNARYYSSTLGRFVSADTIVPEPGNPQALNRYSYVYNSPLKYTDPSGHCPICLIIGIGVALVVWLANPEPVYAPEPGWTPPPEADPNYGDKAFFDAAPGTGDISDAYAAVTGRTLFTGEEVDPGGRAFAATAAVIPLFSSGAFRQGRKFIQGIDNIVPGASTTVRRITGPLSDPLKDALRREARDIFFNANPGLSRDLQVHHRVPLE